MNANIENESDSFYSFGHSASESIGLKDISDIDEDNRHSASEYIDFKDISNIDEDNADTDELHLETHTISSLRSQDLETSDSNTTCTRSLFPKITVKRQLNSTPDRVLLKKCRYELAQSEHAVKMPDLELFDMNALETRYKREALQKIAFTKIWVESQQNKPKQKRSLRGDFQTAMDSYFEKDEIDNFNKLTLQEQQKEEANEHLFVKPFESINRLDTISETEPYISPFEDMPKVPETQKHVTDVKYITVPAGFDLTNLVEYKNPNHWHRRPTTRYDTHA